ncbi:putative S-adenosyl-L-methionine-dependent methyltransferase [Dioscorea sansibarensis]
MDTADSGSLDPSAFKRLAPSRFVSLSFPNPSQGPCSDVLRVAVLDSPLLPSVPPPRVAAMLVPIGRESDWIFCTAAGHLQLLLSSSQDLFLSRLILIGNFPISSCPPMSYTRLQSEPDLSSLHHFQEALFPLLLALCPKAAFKNGVPEIPFLSYEDNVVRSVLVERIEGSVSGEMLVEDVEIDASPAPELRRRLRFKTMPNLVQTQVRLFPDPSEDGTIGPQKGSLVQPYLAPMVAGLSLMAPFLEEKIKLGLRPRALCLGVGGGALLMFLQSKLDFDVLGVEADPVVLSIARQHFGLVEGEFLHVHVGDGIGFIKNVSQQEDTLSRGLERRSDLVEGSRMGFDVIMVDLDAGDAVNGASAPPLEFVQRSVLVAAKMVLHDRGIIVINVIPQSKAFYSELIHDFCEVFAELYEIEVGNGENYVLIATVTNVQLSLRRSCGSWLRKLGLVIDEKHISSINKI